MPFRGQPRYNPRRRSGLGCWLNFQQAGSEYAGATPSIGSSNSSWTNSHYHTFTRLMNSGGPPSPCPSDHPFNSASSSLSESSSSHRSQEDDISIVTGKFPPHTPTYSHAKPKAPKPTNPLQSPSCDNPASVCERGGDGNRSRGTSWSEGNCLCCVSWFLSV